MEKKDSSLSTEERAVPRFRASRRWPSVLLCFVFFLCGMVIGGGGTLIVTKHVMLYRLHHPEKRVLQDAKLLQKKLGLTDEQTREVLAIFREKLKVFDSLRREIDPRVQEQLDNLKRDVAAVLDKGQAQKWNTWFEKTREMWTPPLPSAQDQAMDGSNIP